MHGGGGGGREAAMGAIPSKEHLDIREYWSRHKTGLCRLIEKVLIGRTVHRCRTTNVALFLLVQWARGSVWLY